jgi:2-polyprenyl-6-methoxyphenol hydroxylase-like FAD-dependent oxidoreductase
MTRCQVLIAGAGPTGLVLALWLTKQGVTVRIVDKTERPGTTSRALAVQARTLELYRQLDLADAVVERGHQVPAVNLWVRGERAARVEFGAVGQDMTPFPFLQMFPQDRHEALLIERLSGMGVEVERQTELLGFTDGADGVVAQLRGPDGAKTSCAADYIAGCDGARSVVRHVLGTDFPGGTYQQIFYVADVDASGPSANGELHVDLDEADFLAVFPMDAHGRVRLIGTVRDERAEHPDDLKFDDVSTQAIDHMQMGVRRVNWFSTYRVHHRVTDHFRGGRAFLVGDAAHIHSPAGGQGMNTGLGDAINLAWKLAAVLRGDAPDALLDSYEAERIGFARRLVSTTDRAFSLVSAEGRFADIVRTRLAPIAIPAALSVEKVREYMFRTVSQITLNYRGSPLSVGHVGHVHGGDRLPWSPGGGAEEAVMLSAIAWQVAVYGEASAALRAWCADRAMPLHVFPFTDAHAAAGLTGGAAYLLRPDTYVAVIDAEGRPEALDRYFSERKIAPAAAHLVNPA